MFFIRATRGRCREQKLVFCKLRTGVYFSFLFIFSVCFREFGFWQLFCIGKSRYIKVANILVKLVEVSLIFRKLYRFFLLLKLSRKKTVQKYSDGFHSSIHISIVHSFLQTKRLQKFLFHHVHADLKCKYRFI